MNPIKYFENDYCPDEAWAVLKRHPMNIVDCSSQPIIAPYCYRCPQAESRCCCHRCCEDNNPVPTATLKGIQMQLVGGAQELISAGQSIRFDSAVNDQSPNIDYNPLDGSFTINRAGNYMVSWWVGTNGSDLSSDLWFAIKSNCGSSVIGATPSVTGQMNGQALLTVGRFPCTVTLVNNGVNAVRLPDTPVQADIIIIQV